jgi:2-methylcitrate dehydratase PrpD
VALAMGSARLLARGLWPSYLVAPFGAAATAGRMLGLSPERMTHALALAIALA